MDRIAAIVQARGASTRLPGKMTSIISEKTLLEQTLLRVKAIPEIDNVILATSSNLEDLPLISIAQNLGVATYAGSSDDVLDRYYKAAKSVNSQVTIRLTGDCPLLDPMVCYDILQFFINSNVDYVSNIRPPTYPDGLDVEILSDGALFRAWTESHLKSDREHVTQYIWRNPQNFSIKNYESNEDLSSHRWTVDEKEDLEFIRKIYNILQQEKINSYSHKDVLRVIGNYSLSDTSKKFVRNEGQRKAMKQDGLDYENSMAHFDL